MNQAVIDTQALIWFAEDTSNLSASAVSLVDDPSTIRLASAASLWEMAIKISNGKLTLQAGNLSEFVRLLSVNNVEIMPILGEDAIYVASFRPGRHKDPFDRLIAAQCLRYDFTLVSIDKAFDHYGVRRVW